MAKTRDLSIRDAAYEASPPLLRGEDRAAEGEFALVPDGGRDAVADGRPT